MSEFDLISVILPAYNAEKYITGAIDSVLTQSYTKFELLVINDGSADQTEKIIKSFTDPRIRYFKQDNYGVSEARNTGLASMQGNYFCFLDADDIMPSESLKSRLEVFKSDETIDFVDGKVLYFNKDLSEISGVWVPDFQGNPLKDLLFLSGKCFFGNTWMIKRRKRKIYRFNTDLSHGEDLLFYIELARYGSNYSFTSETILHYRTGHTSAMRDIDGLARSYRQIYEKIYIMEDVPERWKNAYLIKARSIIWKSYLGNWQPVKALKSLFDKWEINVE